MAKTSTEHIAVACTVDFLSPRTVDAGSALTLIVKATCEPDCDLEGETVEILDDKGAVVAMGVFAAYDEEAGHNATGEIEVATPFVVGEHNWSARLAAHEDDEVAYDEVVAPVAFATHAHATSIVVWDVPRGVVAGETFTIKVGIKGSGNLPQTRRLLAIVDESGTEVATFTAGDATWPKSDALYFTEVALKAPDTIGQTDWQVQSAEADLEVEVAETAVAHTAGRATFHVRTVSRPDYKVRIEAWDGAEQVPLKGARVLIHPYSGITDENGVAEIGVAAGDYRVFVSRPKYTTYGAPVRIDGNLEARVDLYLEPPPDRE